MDTKGCIQRILLTKPVCLTDFSCASEKISDGIYIVEIILLAKSSGIAI